MLAVQFQFNAAAGTPRNVIEGFEEAGRLWEDLFADDVTVVVSIAAANLMGPLGSARSITQGFTYTQVRNALLADATSTDDVLAGSRLSTTAALDIYLNLSSDNPNGSGSITPYVDNDGGTNNTRIEVPRANARALGLIAPSDPGADGSITFDTTNFTFDFDRSDGITAGQTDFVFVAAHEIGHILGFDSGIDGPDVNDGQGGRPGPFAENDTFSTGALIFGPTVLDLFRSSAASLTNNADLDLTADNRVKNFSIDGGTTVLGTFSRGRNNGDGNQGSHWEDIVPPASDPLGIMDPNAGNGEFGEVTALDLLAFDVIGWDLAIDDRFEENDTLGSATPLGSEPALTISDLTIGVNDEDFFKYTANRTGKLVVNALFNDEAGDLGMEILDMNGNVLGASNGAQDNETIVVPVVSQQMYFVRIFGAPAFAVNEYTLEIENFAAPAPTGVHLDPASDTGMMNNDNVTSDTTPTFVIQTDVLEFVDVNQNGVADATEIDVLSAAEAASGIIDGVAVEVTLVNTTTGTSTTGFADPIVIAVPEVYRFTPAAPLAAGVYLVSARLKIFDGRRNGAGAPTPAMGRSTASPPLWITIDNGAEDGGRVSADMVASSDTGMSNIDNVTNKMSPAFNGIAPAGSKVRLYANGDLVGQTVTGSDTSDVGRGPIGGIGGLADDLLGLWEITSEPLADGAYNITLEVEDAAGNVTQVNPIFNPAVPATDIVIDTLAPNTPLLDLIDDTGRHNNDNITKDNTPQAAMTTTDPNGALARLLFTDNFKFRLYDRFQGSAQEVLIYDSAVDAVADAATTAADMFTSLTQLTRTLPVLVPANPAILGGALANGVHHLKLEVEDRAGNISPDFLLEITVDAVAPPVSFGLPDGASQLDGLVASSDTGVATMPATFADRVTSDATPSFWGRAEADSIVRLFLDRNDNGAIDLLTDTFLAQTVAVPFDGNDAYPDGYWEATSALDLNQIVGLPKDGLRRILVTAEDVAGNPMAVANQIAAATVDELQIFIDTQGPQVTDVTINNLTSAQYDLFDPKPMTTGPTPLVESLRIAVRDLANRFDAPLAINDFLYEALKQDVALAPGNYQLVGDHVGVVPIQSIAVTNNPVVGGAPATASIVLRFFAPLPDDRYTLTVRDNLVDPAGNRLDGESNASEPQESPQFPTGDGLPGGAFVGRFTVDSRPEIASYLAQQINIDINGNFAWDPGNVPVGGDAVNVDLTFTMQFANPVTGAHAPGGFGVHDLVFAGKFGSRPGSGAANGFDTLAVYGHTQDFASFRWLVDRNSDGVVNTADGDILTLQPTGGLPGDFNAVGAIPVAGNFDRNLVNGDEIGLYNSGRWALDSNRNFVIDPADTFIVGTLFGHPIVGDFDRDGLDDLGIFNHNTWHFDMAFDGLGGSNLNGFGADVAGTDRDDTLIWGFPGVLDRPVAADMDRDGVDDIGLWVPRDNAQIPTAVAEWYFLTSHQVDARGVPTVGPVQLGTVNVLDHPYEPAPFGFDLYAEFGNERVLPLVGNFDPPVTADAPTQTSGMTGDFDRDSDVDGFDFLAWQRGVGQSDATLAQGDANGDRVVGSGDLGMWSEHFGEPAAATASVVGDFNANGIVEGGDFLAWQRGVGQSSAALSQGDANGDRVVQDDDLALWSVHFGAAGAAAAATTVATAAATAPADVLLSSLDEGAEFLARQRGGALGGSLALGAASTGDSYASFAVAAAQAVESAIKTSEAALRPRKGAPVESLDAAFATASHNSTAVDLTSPSDRASEALMLATERVSAGRRNGWRAVTGDREVSNKDSDAISAEEWEAALQAVL